MTLSHTLENRTQTTAVSATLILTSLLWFASAFVYYVTSDFRKDWLATPLLWMLAVMLMPSLCFSCIILLVAARKRTPFTRLQWCAIATSILPVTAGTFLAVWVVKGLFAMSGL